MNANNRNNRNELPDTQTSPPASGLKRKATLPDVTTNKQQLLQGYSVRNAMTLTENAERCIFGNAPTLWQANNAYGRGTAEELLVYHLADLGEYTGVRDKMTTNQIRQMAELIAADYGYVKISEFMLFCRRMKAGRYGSFYGVVDPMVIMSALRTFILERNDMISEHEQQKEQERQEKAMRGCVSYEEYLKTKKHTND